MDRTPGMMVTQAAARTSTRTRASRAASSIDATVVSSRAASALSRLISGQGLNPEHGQRRQRQAKGQGGPAEQDAAGDIGGPVVRQVDAGEAQEPDPEDAAPEPVVAPPAQPKPQRDHAVDQGCA